MSLIDAALAVVYAYPGGPESLAPRLGMGAMYLRQQVTCHGTAKLGLIDAGLITQITGNLGILHAFATECGQTVVPLPVVDVRLPCDEYAFRGLALASQDFGDLISEVSGALADGSISDNEIVRIKRKAGGLIASLHALQVTLATHNAAGRPA